MIRGYRVWDNQEKAYSDKAFSIDQFGLCYVQDEDGYWEEIDDTRFIVEFETGLIDKNEKMIYEGDIIKVVNVHDGDEECWEQPYGPAIPQEVKWNEELLRWSFGGCRRILCVPEDFEVIGNIHENPELLEGQK